MSSLSLESGHQKDKLTLKEVHFCYECLPWKVSWFLRYLSIESGFTEWEWISMILSFFANWSEWDFCCCSTFLSKKPPKKPLSDREADVCKCLAEIEHLRIEESLTTLLLFILINESVSWYEENQEDEVTANRDARINFQLTTFMKCFNNMF